MSTSLAVINMTAEVCCAAARDGSQYCQVLIRQPGVLLDEPRRVCPNDIGHFDRGPGHLGFRSLLYSGIGIVDRTLMFSSGFATACK